MKNMNLMAPINSLGYGVAGLNILKALRQDTAVCLSIIGSPEVTTQEDADAVQESVSRKASFDPSAPCLKVWHEFDMAERIGNGPFFGFPFFEITRFDEPRIRHLGSTDGVIVTSEWAASVVKDNIKSAQTHVCPLGVDRSVFNEHGNVRSNVCDFLNCGKWEVRKGHDILVKAFNEAFGEEDDVELWMMCENPFYSREENANWEMMYKESGLGNKIRMIPRQQTQNDVYNIMIQTDCGVFPARAEGWNLELLEMMSCGKQVIATNYSAHTEFCDNNNCLLIDTDGVEPAQDGKWFFGQGNWAKIEDAQFNSLVEHLRMIHDLKQSGNLHTNSGGIETAKKYSWENTAKEIINATSP